MGNYAKPSKRLHRGFVYLDDEIVTNSLSAFESGKIDEVVAKVNQAREGGLAGGVGGGGLRLDGGKKSSSELEEAMVRTRTRFSVFELWLQSLKESKAVGMFDGWGPEALQDVEVGDTVEFRARLEITPLQTLWQLFLWFADQAKNQNSLFAQKGEALKVTKESERNVRSLLGDESAPQVVVLATPLGDVGPEVSMPIKTEWLIGAAGRLGGEYTVVGQVDRILGDGEELPVMRLTRDVAPTPLEIQTWKDVVGNFVEPASDLGVEISEDHAVVRGPALWVEPIAIFR